MRRLALAALAAVLASAVTAAPAHAAADSTFDGYCGWASVSDPLPSGDAETYDGVLLVRTVVYSRTTPADNAVSADVTCRVLVNGVEVDRATFSGTTLVAGARRTTFDARVTDVVWICTDVDYTSNDTPSETCAYEWDEQLPPRRVVEVLNDVFAVTDPVTCAALRSLAPGVPGTLEVDPDTGDTYVAGELLWDCPPYGWG